MVAQECTSTSRPQRDRPCSALCLHYVRTTPVVFPHRFHGISAVLPHCSRGISALFPRYLCTVAAVLVLLLVWNYPAERSLSQFWQVHLIEKTVAETLSDQSDVFSYGVVVSYKSVYTFNSKFCSVCLVFMYTYWFSGYSFKRVMEIIWEST